MKSILKLTIFSLSLSLCLLSAHADEKKALKKANSKDSMEWVLIKGGVFTISYGKDSAQQIGVTVPSFMMSKSEVTVSAYRDCVEAGACTQPNADEFCNWGKADRDQHPVNCVDWSQARAFARWIGGDLPSESEWEYAARSQGKQHIYSWGSAKPSCEYAVMDEGGHGCGQGMTAPVCSKPKGNTLNGLCDMSGNVWEWVLDEDQSPRPTPPTDGSAVCKTPKCENKKAARIDRGGGWVNSSRVRTTSRGSLKNNRKFLALGFRVRKGI